MVPMFAAFGFALQVVASCSRGFVFNVFSTGASSQLYMPTRFGNGCARACIISFGNKLKPNIFERKKVESILSSKKEVESISFFQKRS